MKAHTRQRFKSVCGIKTKLTNYLSKKDSCMLFFYPFETLFSHLSIKRWIGSFVFIDHLDWSIWCRWWWWRYVIFSKVEMHFWKVSPGFQFLVLSFVFSSGGVHDDELHLSCIFINTHTSHFFEKVTQPNSPLISPTRNHIQQPLYASSHQEKVIQNWMKARAGREEEENGRRQKTLNPMTISQSNY